MSDENAVQTSSQKPEKPQHDPVTGKFARGNTMGSRNKAGGRPRKLLREILDNAVSDSDWEHIFARARVDAKDGDPRAREFLAQRRWGLPTQRTELSGPDEGPITVVRHTPSQRPRSRVITGDPEHDAQWERDEREREVARSRAVKVERTRKGGGGKRSAGGK